MTTLKHYYHPMSRAVSTDWMLKELDAPHEQILVDFPAGANNTPEYRAINPMGKIPALADGDEVVTETAAICAYLADKFPEKNFAPPTNSPERGKYYRYLFYPSAVLEPMFTVDMRGIEGLDPKSVGWGDLERCMTTIELMVPEKDWALGSQFTAADVVFGGTLDFFVKFGMLKEPSAKVMAYIERIRNRPAYKQSHPEF